MNTACGCVCWVCTLPAGFLGLGSAFGGAGFCKFARGQLVVVSERPE